jgi:hypothetical protein
MSFWTRFVAIAICLGFLASGAGEAWAESGKSSTGNNGNSTGLSRGVRIVAKKARGMRGMTAKNTVNISGTILTDSFDSSDPQKSTGGLYDPAKAGEDGFIGTTAKTAGAIVISGEAKIIGPIGTGAGATVSVSGSGAVGSRAYVQAGQLGIQPGWRRDDLNMAFPDVAPPFTATTLPVPVAPLPGRVGTNNYDFVFGDGNYQLPTFLLDGKQKAIVTGNATFYVLDTFTVKTEFIIAPGAQLNLYVGKKAVIEGQGVINNSGKAENFNYYGLPTNTEIYFRGQSPFVSAVYAPSAKMDLAGGSRFIGASVSSQIVLSGIFSFHYDEALGGTGGRYIPVSWREQ